MFVAVANKEGLAMHKSAAGRTAHFFVLINGVSFVRVGVSTERERAFVVCGPRGRVPLPGVGARRGGGAAVPTVWTESLRQGQAWPLSGSWGWGSWFPRCVLQRSKLPPLVH